MASIQVGIAGRIEGPHARDRAGGSRRFRPASAILPPHGVDVAVYLDFWFSCSSLISISVRSLLIPRRSRPKTLMYRFATQTREKPGKSDSRASPSNSNLYPVSYQEDRRDIVAEAVLACKQVKELTLEEPACTARLFRIAVFAGFAKHLFVRDSPCHGSTGMARIKQPGVFGFQSSLNIQK